MTVDDITAMLKGDVFETTIVHVHIATHSR